MLFDIISVLIGITKIYLYKLFNITKISFKSVPKMNHSFKIAVKNGSEKELGNALLSLCKNASLRVQRSVACRHLAEKEYRLDKYVDEHILLYKQVLGGVC